MHANDTTARSSYLVACLLLFPACSGAAKDGDAFSGSRNDGGEQSSSAGSLNETNAGSGAQDTTDTTGGQTSSAGSDENAQAGSENAGDSAGGSETGGQPEGGAGGRGGAPAGGRANPNDDDDSPGGGPGGGMGNRGGMDDDDEEMPNAGGAGDDEAGGMDANGDDANAGSSFMGEATCDAGPLDGPLADCKPETPPSSGDFYQDCVDRINQLRWECQCLPPLERWVEAEDCADQQAEYDYNVDQAHAGTRADICSPSGAQNECPDYGPNFPIVGFCLQQMWDEGPGEDFQVHGHYLNMTDPNHKKVACGLFETPEGNFWSVQNFSR